jgi:hypothetical protein
MFGPFYNDLCEPFIFADVPAVTLATTDKALYPTDNFPVLGGHFFGRAGRKLHIRLFGKITTAATPGNLTIDVYYGDGTDANGVLLASSAAVALTAGQTNLSFAIDIYVHCRAPGKTGSLFVTGELGANVGVIASTLQPVMIPASAAVVSGACDLTAAKIISVQAKRSGSTVETIAVQDMEITVLN